MNGPTIKLTCNGCVHLAGEYYRCQSDSGTNWHCTHPDFTKRFIADSCLDTPDWCPEISATFERVSGNVGTGLALRNCRSLAARKLSQEPDSDWRHILRFCEVAGVKPSILREPEDKP